MIKRLMRVGNSQGIILDKAVLDLLHIKEGSSFDISAKNGGLFLKPVGIEEVYQEISKRHRRTLNKLGR